MNQIEEVRLRSIQRSMQKYDRVDMVSIAAGLLTCPNLLGNTIRLEFLVHSAALYAHGSRRPTRTYFHSVLNDELSSVRDLEDPPEDVFISSVFLQYGEFRLFNGLYEGSDYHVQNVLNILESPNLPRPLGLILEDVSVLLTISEAVASRCGSDRYVSKSSSCKGNIRIPSLDRARSFAQRVIFSEQDFFNLGLSLEKIAEFVISDREIAQLEGQNAGYTLLNRKPIVQIGDRYIVALPGSISVAIKYHVLSQCSRIGLLTEFQGALDNLQMRQMDSEILNEYKESFRSINLEIPIAAEIPRCKCLLLSNDQGRYLLAVLIHDDLQLVLEEGLDTFVDINGTPQAAMNEFIENLILQCEERQGFRSGSVLIFFGGMGRGYMWPGSKIGSNWIETVASMADMLLLKDSKNNAVEDYLLCMHQQEWVRQCGVTIFNINGDFNYYQFWKENNYYCIPLEMPTSEGSLFNLATDFILQFRKDLRLQLYRHSVKDFRGKLRTVSRFSNNPLFKGQYQQPIYICLEDVSRGNFNVVIESDSMVVWLALSGFPKGIPESDVFDWWEGFVNIFSEMIEYIGERAVIGAVDPIQMDLNFSRVVALDQDGLGATSSKSIECRINKNSYAELILEENFLANFNQPENTGERLVAQAMLQCACELFGQQGLDISPYTQDAIDRALGDPSVRLVHIFKAINAIDYLEYTKSKSPVLCERQYIEFHKIRVASIAGLKAKKIEAKIEAKIFLNSLVDIIWSELKEELKKYNKNILLIALGDCLNDLEQDRLRWRRTAKAMSVIHAKHGDVVELAGNRESFRSLSSIGFRGLVEMAACESCNSGGLAVTKHDLNNLLALSSILISTASDSDAVHGDLVEPEIDISENGLYFFGSDVTEQVLLPYFRGYFDREFSTAILEYGDLYELDDGIQDGDSSTALELEFVEVFKAEYGLSPDDYFQLTSTLLEVICSGNGLHLFSTRDALKTNLIESGPVSGEVVEFFLSMGVLGFREKWDDIPEGSETRDVMPWKFKRKLSCLVRPIIDVGGGDLYCSAFLVRQSAGYFLSRVYNGDFNAEFYQSSAMKSYVGDRLRIKGADFTQCVYEHFASSGWTVRKEVEMSSLGAPSEFGDIDVLLVSSERKVIVLECKNLQMAKTISEIADICNRFKGEEKDEMSKHLRRVEWVERNLIAVSKALNSEELRGVDHALVTSTEMPIKYQRTLPIRPSKIVSFKNIESIFTNAAYV